MKRADEIRWITEDTQLLRKICEMKGGKQAVQTINIYSKLIESNASRGMNHINVDIEPFNRIQNKTDAEHSIKEIQRYFERYGYTVEFERSEFTDRIEKMIVKW